MAPKDRRYLPKKTMGDDVLREIWELDHHHIGTIDTVHRWIHRGLHFVSDDDTTLALADDEYFWRVQTTGSDYAAHLSIGGGNTAGTVWEVFKSGVITSNGALLRAENSNQRSPNKANAIVYANTQVSNNNNGSGVRIRRAQVGAGFGPQAIWAAGGERNEFELLSNTDYLIKATSQGIGNVVTINLSWYEEPEA